MRLWLGSPTEGLAQATDTLVEWLVASLATPGVTHGFVHVDGLADPYGIVVENSRFPGTDLSGRVEGYYWCLALGEAQVAGAGRRPCARPACATSSPRSTSADDPGCCAG